MGTLKIVKGDLIEYSIDKTAIFIVHVVNAGNSMGSGVAKALFDKWPQVKSRYHKWFDGDNSHCSGKAILGNVQYVRVDDNFKNQFVINMIGQDYPGGHTFNINGKEMHLAPVRYKSLEKCMLHIAEDVYRTKEKTGVMYRIIAPWFAAGLAGGTKKETSELINRIWVDNGIDVTICEQ
jgi:O-acetyl-ADP-ribose deacetylase (regulator of RNase III)